MHKLNNKIKYLLLIILLILSPTLIANQSTSFFINFKSKYSANINFGYRQLLTDCILGTTIFYDERRNKSKNLFSQLTFSLECLRKDIELNGTLTLLNLTNGSKRDE